MIEEVGMKQGQYHVAQEKLQDLKFLFDVLEIKELEIYKHTVKSVQTALKSNAEQALKELDD